MSKLDVLVLGATGRQGGAVARALLHAGHRVRALTPDLAHPNAEALRLRGARLAWAAPDDEVGLAEAVASVDAVFMTSAASTPPAAETQQGLLLADLARRYDTRHIVYSSAMAALHWTGVPQSDSKHEIEQYLRAAQVPHTVVCPAFFMENFLDPDRLAGLQRGELRLPLSPADRLQQLACTDLGQFVRLVLERRDHFLGRRICIAADELPPLGIAAVFARALGHPVQFIPADDVQYPQQSPDTALLYGWPKGGVRAEIDRLRRDYPEVNWHALSDWAAQQNWSRLGQQTRA